VTDTNKVYILREFQRQASGLRKAAEAVNKAVVAENEWGPREVLAHITFWAVQATEQFRLHLPPLDYGDASLWGPELVGTFSAAFVHLAGPGLSPDDSKEAGWRAVAEAGVSLPLSVPLTPELHTKVDEAFNAGAVALVRGQSFGTVLGLTERAHQSFYRLLAETPVSDYSSDGYLYRRMVLVIEHHDVHRSQLEAELAQLRAPLP
jgi:hypothetical protein